MDINRPVLMNIVIIKTGLLMSMLLDIILSHLFSFGYSVGTKYFLVY